MLMSLGTSEATTLSCGLLGPYLLDNADAVFGEVVVHRRYEGFRDL